MRTVLVRAGIAAIGVFALTAAGCRKSAGENTDRAAALSAVADTDHMTVYMTDHMQGLTAGVSAYLAAILREIGISETMAVAESGAPVGLSGDTGDGMAEPGEGSDEGTYEGTYEGAGEDAGVGTGEAPVSHEEADGQVEERNRCLTGYFGYVPDDEELDLFYRTVQAECGNTEPYDGIGAVADVIANRCRSDIFPDTLTEVITQENQFTSWSNGAIEEAKVQPWVYEICDAHISEGAVYDDIYYFTAGYYNPYCEPAFVIGNHYFGR